MNGNDLQLMKSLGTFETPFSLRTGTIGLCAGLALGAALLALPYPGRAAEAAEITTSETNSATDWRTPTRITMKCQDAAPEEVLDELAKAADISLEAMNTMAWSSTGTITLDVKDRPFWPVFIDACRQARVDFQTYANDRSPRRIQLNPGTENHLAAMPMYEAAGCLLIFQSASRTHQIQYGSGRGSARFGAGRGPPMSQGGAASQGSVNFNLQALLLVDPRFRPAGEVRTTLTTATDENGTSFLRPNYDQSGQVYYSGQPRGFFLQANFNLNYPTNAGRQLAKLEGNLRIPTILKEQTWEISDVLNAKPETKELDGRSVTIESIRKNQNSSFSSGLYEVKISYKVLAESEAPGLRRTPSDLYPLIQSITLLAADGTPLNHSGGGGSSSGTSGSYTASFSAQDKDTVPSKLIWKVPTDTREIVVPFSVTDLPIP